MGARKGNIRVYAVGAIFVLATFGLWTRLFHVQVLSHAFYKEQAEDQWRTYKKIPPIRGAIFDRNGRPLALSVRSYSVSIHPKEVKNRNEVISVLSRTLSITKSSVRRKLRSGKQFVWVKRRCFPREKDLKVLASLPGVGVHREADRVYPYGNVGNKVVGFVGYDNHGMAGAEAAFDEELGGVPGLEEILMNGEYRSSGYFRYQLKEPKNGNDVFLTIDASIQDIAEFELERAVIENHARGGSLIVMEIASGEILALAEYPAPKNRAFKSPDDSLWTIRSISCIYEPGSTFKLITAAALLEEGKVSPEDLFDAENGTADFKCARITDPHPHGEVTFEEAFTVSSNIAMAKASLLLTPKEFYKRIRLFGFGSKTGIRLSGESPGSISSIDSWSKRTQITLAFGQEIATTPLQMLCAFAAVANGGALMIPRIIKATVDGQTGKPKFIRPIWKRNVVSGKTARILRSFCGEVVKSGTGMRAAVDFMEVAGKTGTAQKACRPRGYLPGKFVASFIGFAPLDSPKIACLVMLDEPDPKKRFGSDSAAPAFAGVNRAIANTSSFFDGVLAGTVVRRKPPEARQLKTPNFIRMNRWAALERARKLGAKVVCHGEEGNVFAQDPDPGVPMKKNDVLNLYVRTGLAKGAKCTIPDLRGLPIRAAKRRAADAGLKCVFVGSGFVRSQKPPPGKRTAKGTVTLYCDRGRT
ncbi:MAG: PASTA domain-containing protein [Candidatus Latescibacteria bacterium]|nr:PASTA domain-containing protein [Candidatus Latescibacterota bacterium]NIM21078.1 PASTA domain-containing protein [Candidatus Latescibacterota bacterium]NIM65213.1 PASTA domain-containing protein [Candidatus Latescibacterota bacterium]NIO01728.1 PASTA domain-containing protein [Candidatus Latescibacterota bacterium]NIO28245.1 PASTA domain-containing protein [Candidatus Latescibacterota bacterium]